jgi:UDP-3-O-[3-hydroxymyristoyl] N-acetylglucosamine deacetylase
MNEYQRTLKSTIRFSGIGLHSGAVVSVEIRPATANTGILFQRTDLPGSPYIKASAEAVFDTSLATRIGTPEIYVSTIEHLMAAFYGFGIDNAIVALNSFELPILDGSAAPFLVLLDEAGISILQVPRKVLAIKKVVEVVDAKNPERFIRIEPSRKPWISYVIDFNQSQAIGRQSVSLEYTGISFCEEFSFARTFCLAEEVAYMQSRGLARGGSLENAIVVSKHEGIVNEGGLRAESEFVRHKVLDCIGDLALVGMPLLGHVIAHKAGHDLHTELAKKILSELALHKVSEPVSREAGVFRDLLKFPESLAEVRRQLARGLVIG